MKSILSFRKRGFTIIELLVVIGIMGFLYWVYSALHGVSATAKDYANDISIDIKSIATNVIRPMKGDDTWLSIATTLGANDQWVDVGALATTNSGKLVGFSDQFVAATQGSSKLSEKFQRKVALTIEKAGPTVDAIGINGQTVPKDSISANDIYSVMELCVAVDSTSLSLPADYSNGAICSIINMATNSNITSYIYKTMPTGH